MPLLERLYTAALLALRPALPLLGRGEGKLARGVRGRRGVLRRMEEWVEAERDPRRPLVWFHAPSVGEGLQARAVMEVFRRRNPEVQVVYTFFSPSAEALASRMPAELAAYLPLDLPGEVGRALDLLRPRALAFSKADVWPNLTREAERRGVRLALLSGTLPASSSRLGGPARALLAPAYARLDRVAAISEADAERFAALGVPAERRSVMGDAHFDRALARAAAVDRRSPLLRPLADPSTPTLVAGSTWSADEERLLPALRRLRGEGIAWRLLLVPHEPSPAHLREAGARLDALGLGHVRISALRGRWNGDEVLLVDRVGILGDLYAVGDLAYVGGGWGSAGLHSVLEPAAYGLPVVFGPRHSNAREAGELVARRGAFSEAAAAGLGDRLRSLLSDPEDRARSGEAARTYVAEGLGAAERGAATLEELL